MAVNLSPVGGVAAQFFTNSGVPLTGGKIFTYAAGTTTPQASYTTSQGNVAWTNPIVLDAAGRVPSGGEIWLTDGLIYKFVLKDANDVLIATYDNITGINSNSVAFTNSQEIQTATAGQTVFTLTTMQYQVGTNSLSVFVDGVNQYGPGAQYAYTETSSTVVTFVSGLHVGAEVKFTTTQQQSAGAVAASQVSFTGFKGQIGNVQDLAGNDGSDWIGFDPASATGTARSAQDKMQDFVSVTDFGASPSATAAQNQTAFEAALTASNSVYVPEGEFTITGPLYVYGTGKKFYGAGMAATKLVINGGNEGVIVGNPSGESETNHGICVSDMWISGGTYALQTGTSNSPLTFLGEVSRVKLTGATVGGLFLYQAIASFNDLEITGNYRGVVSLTVANGGGTSTASMFNRCRIYTNTNQGCYFEAAWGWQFNECNLESNGKEAVKFEKVDGTTLTNVTFNSCWFESNLTDGLLSSATVYVNQTGTSTPSNINFNECEFNGVTGSGSGNIHIIGPIDGISLINNRFLTPSSACVDMAIPNMAGVALQDAAIFVDSSRVNILGGEIQLTAAATPSTGATTNHVSLGASTATSVGAAGGASALPATPLGYLIAYVGTTQVKIPYYSA